jgi:hypothetical protein
MQIVYFQIPIIFPLFIKGSEANTNLPQIMTWRVGIPYLSSKPYQNIYWTVHFGNFYQDIKGYKNISG